MCAYSKRIVCEIQVFSKSLLDFFDNILLNDKNLKRIFREVEMAYLKNKYLIYLCVCFLSFLISFGSIHILYTKVFTPYFTVIISSYNYGHFLEETLQSLYNSTYKNFEVIVINDGSHDTTQEIMDKYRKNHLRFYTITQKNQGLSVARNRAMKYAKGKYIWFIDADDWIEKRAMEKLVRRAEKTDADIVSFYTQTHKGKLYPYDLLPRLLKNNQKKVFTINEFDMGDIYSYPVTSGKQIYKRSFIEKNNLTFPEHTLFEDDVFFLHAIFSGAKTNGIPAIFYHKRPHENSIVHNREKYYDSLIRIVRLIYENAHATGRYEDKALDLFRAYSGNMFGRWQGLSDERKYHYYPELEKMALYLEEKAKQDEHFIPYRDKMNAFLQENAQFAHTY